ncbi:hypothetical protein JTE90_018027 [Oedothorax gibbosus]|uniref:Secreted protein n=1 Tax=Oedothorax gibbosus TaxID=931172 RepID=A0AAV6V740_9ARAC|nr:hypothetical protein JTE90_018027 [Oedothorax gibbosus]
MKASFVEAVPCGRNKYLECFDAYGSASLEEMTEAIKCSNKRRLARCLTEFGHECYMDEYWKEHIETAFREAEKCNGVLGECLDESITVTSALTCVEKSLTDLGNYVIGNPGQNKNRMTCTLAPLVVRCIIDDASDKCGQDATPLKS